MLQPKKVKHRKVQKGRLRGKSHRGNVVSFGDYGLQALGTGFVSARQIEAARIAMTRYIKPVSYTHLTLPTNREV